MKKNGVSVIICCYNSASRIKGTLTALAKQVFTYSLPWEIIVIDNNSTDHTAWTAETTWQDLGAPVAITILNEPVQGLTHARKKGIEYASFSVLLLCDDDNWLSPNYVQEIHRELTDKKDAAACGGKGIPLFETGKPDWFDGYAEAFATGPQDMAKENGKILSLYGAGLAIKWSALEKLNASGFSPLFNDRTGGHLSSSGDTELTNSFVLMGYRLYYLDDLSFYHYLPENRLTPEYLQRLFTAFGKDGPTRNLYYAYLSDRRSHMLIRNWYYHLLLILFRKIKYYIKPPKKNGRLIYAKWCNAYMKELFEIKNRYCLIKENIERIKYSREIPVPRKRVLISEKG